MKGRKPDELRGEGFGGQRMIVIPAPVLASAANEPLLRGLRVTDAGFFPNAKGHYVERRTGADTHLMILCVAGQGEVGVPDRAGTELKAREVVCIPASQPHTYGASVAQPWSIAWVHYEGKDSVEWHRQMGGMGAVRSLSPAASAEVARHLEAIYRTLEFGYSVPQMLLASAYLQAALARIVAENVAPVRPEAEDAVSRVADSVEWMRGHPETTVRLDELAAMAGLSVPHYRSLFRRRTGFSPINYMTRLRIQRACQELATSNLPVAEIGRTVGFEDAYYFSRTFRAIMGVSPRAYRSSRRQFTIGSNPASPPPM